MKPRRRGRPQHATISPQRNRRNLSDPPRRVQAEAIPRPLPATRWPRRFDERGWPVSPQEGNSAAGLRARTPARLGFVEGENARSGAFNFGVPRPVLMLTAGLVLFLVALQTVMNQFNGPRQPTPLSSMRQTIPSPFVRSSTH